MGLDIRTPLGLIFAILGGIMVVYGLLTRGSAMYAVATNLNVNLLWGAVMLVFGAGMLIAARRRRS